ncbi:glycine betaine/L-proline ABC transporter substrate-binding protein ProX [Mesorhizobium sp. M0904]|uniref:glycine betaine/L-proline ABC transporter substrate-binding protein ProX n=1 Tax=Mesorhizobium sp. M0904 TaxID=2957022 RepID=UPI003338576A
MHQSFFEEAGGSKVMTKVGNLVQGALQGYLVDKKTYDSCINNRGQLKDPKVAALFDADGHGKADLAGCVPGWGCERIIEHQLDEYKLRDTVTHNQGEYNAIIADTIARLKTGNPVLLLHLGPLLGFWCAGPWQRCRLAVPYTSQPDGKKADTTINGKNTGFPVDNIRVVARNNFLAKNPAARKLFELVTIPVNDVSEENMLIKKGEKSMSDIDRHVDGWIEKHRSQYESWLKAVRSASK